MTLILSFQIWIIPEVIFHQIQSFHLRNKEGRIMVFHSKTTAAGQALVYNACILKSKC